MEFDLLGPLVLEDAVRRAAQFGYDAACIYAHRPLGFPLDLDRNRRKRLKDLYRELDLEMGAIVCCTSFLEANHVLLYPQEKEILYVRECIRLAKDLGASIVRILAGFYGYFQNPFAGQGYGLPSFESRSRRVSRGEDWLEAWHQVQRGIREVAFLKACREIGYDGLLSAEQCSPIIRSHQLGTVPLVDERYVASLAFLKGLLLKLGAYTGHKKSPA
ncbi:MAG: TIM barrel protein [Planctomycetes bacterium]|nr:TIM barrel protein [Planctomycetota bacterium]